jgi:chorismate synthase
MLRYLTAGESHGKGLTAILEGVPAGLALGEEDINRDLARRQVGYGRGARMKIERDKAEILSGVRGGETLGNPIALFIKNQDWANWEEIMSTGPDVRGATREVTRPRPGHADLPGGMKYRHRDLRNVLERSSARETAARVAVGAIARKLLHEFGIQMASHVVEIGGVGIERGHTLTTNKIRRLSDKSDLRCVDSKAADKMKSRIDKAAKEGDSLGGIFEVKASGVPVGLGSHVHYDRKLNSRLAGAIMSIQAIKGVEIGSGFESARRPGSDVHDEIFYSKAKGFYRKSNRAGGIEGGISNGEDIVIRAAMKPIPTLRKPLRSVDINTKRSFKASVERSDVCAVPAAAVIAEAVVAFELARGMTEKFGGDSILEMKMNYESYLKSLRDY